MGVPARGTDAPVQSVSRENTGAATIHVCEPCRCCSHTVHIPDTGRCTSLSLGPYTATHQCAARHPTKCWHGHRFHLDFSAPGHGPRPMFSSVFLLEPMSRHTLQHHVKHMPGQATAITLDVAHQCDATRLANCLERPWSTISVHLVSVGQSLCATQTPQL